MKEGTMPNRRAFDHIGNYNFKVEIEGVTVGAFMEVSGLESTTEVLETGDGDDLNVRKRPGRTSYTNIVLRRGFTNTDELWKWRQQVVNGQVERKSGSIVLCDDTGGEIMRYNFFEAWPCRWKSSMLSARERGTVFEEIEIVVEKIERG
jgi:phage tail-like protein